MHKGFYISKLVVIGKNVDPAQMSLQRGLNVLSGASNTGKSYVFQCINYALGSSKPPKDIPESKGYDEIRLQINSYNGKEYTLCRKFNDNKIYLAESKITDVETVETKKLSAQHSSKSEDNISYFLLNLIGLVGKKLKKNKWNEKREISFRDLTKLCLVDEELIISDISPIFTGQHISRTIEESVFKLIMTGKDDDSLESLEDPKIYRNKIKGKLEFIEGSIDKKREQLDELNEVIRDLEIEKINVMIEEFTKFINKSHQNVKDEEDKRSEIWNEMESIRIQLAQSEELEKRFFLLDEHYNSDLDRLEFINEGKQYIDQLKEVNCPICGSLIEQKLLEKYEEESSEKIIESLIAEASKIRLKKKELKETIDQIQKEKNELTVQFNIKKKEFQRIDTYIKNKLEPIVEINRKKLEEFLKLKDKKSRISIIKEEINALEKEKIYYISKLEEKDKRSEGRVISVELYNKLTNYIQQFINNWGYDCKSVYFDKSKHDIEIDGKSRANFGKGYRAIFQSAFMIGLMEYCSFNNKYHPFFLILDSPLTAYKEQDLLPTEEDRISEDIQNLFYKNLEKYDKNSELQIFIIENKDPPASIKESIQYEHFSRNEQIGRYGFYPISK